MAELINCPRCGRLFIKNRFRDVCEQCYREEEQLFEKVYQFLRKRENRTATMAQVVKETGVSERLIVKWIKAGRIKLVHFPNLGYPCEKCGKMIREGRICKECNMDLQKQLKQLEQEQQRLRQQNNPTYYVSNQDKD
ncbi:flagellar operon protein (TIGR03826 family) [Anoxybacillus vitaminiphilus]|uniref:Flagellar operon protein (TIGR03826 family) n=1 Tax=Paranoxybacillus vitaminiphilus TaxID=581036 RepID=A0A327YHV2_9BACL|nr:TIGR03826 family flagellar region protein [Anoxybacillus vitaminiphilus]RAK19922.1 flagellar operon protein (TIGR03826 family) [Anoxybacillus vitaminiphilus]